MTSRIAFGEVRLYFKEKLTLCDLIRTPILVFFLRKNQLYHRGEKTQTRREGSFVNAVTGYDGL